MMETLSYTREEFVSIFLRVRHGVERGLTRHRSARPASSAEFGR